MTRIEACSSGAGPPPPPLKRLRLSRNRQVCSKRAPLESLELHNTLDPIHPPLDQQPPAAGSLEKEHVGDLSSSSSSHLNQQLRVVSASNGEGPEQRTSDIQVDSVDIQVSRTTGNARPGAPFHACEPAQLLGDNSAGLSSCRVELAQPEACISFNERMSPRIGVRGGFAPEETYDSRADSREDVVDTEVAGTDYPPTGRLVVEGIVEAEDGASGGSAEVVDSQREGPRETEAAENNYPPVADRNVIVHEHGTQVRVEAQGAEFPAEGNLVPCCCRLVAENGDETSVSIREETSVEADPSCPHPVFREEVVQQVIGEEHRSAPQLSNQVECCSHTLQGINGNPHESLLTTEDNTLLRTSETLEATDSVPASQHLLESRLPDGPLPPLLGSNQQLVDSSVRDLTSSEENINTDEVAANTLQMVDFSDANEAQATVQNHVIIEDQAAVGLASFHGDLPFEGGLLSGFNQQIVGSPGEIRQSTVEDLTGRDVVDILNRTVRIVQALETYSRSPDPPTGEEHVDPRAHTRSTGSPTEAELMARVPNQQMAESVASESTREVTAEDVRNIYAQAGAVVLAAGNWLGLSEMARRRAIENINVNANWESLLQENVPREASLADAQDEPVGLGDNPTDDHKRPDQAADQSGLQTQEPTAADGLACPICMEPWTNTGEHRICSLACGHLFGKSCIKRWIKQSGRRLSKCPHCNKRAKVEDLRNIYVPYIAVSDGQGYEMAQEVKRLTSENEELKRMNVELQMEMDRLRRSQATATAPGAGVLQKVDINRSEELANARKRQSSLQTFFGRNDRRRSSARSYEEHWLEGGQSKGHTGGHRSSSSLASIGNRGLGENFSLQDEVHLLGAKVFDMDAYSQMVLVSNKAANNGSTFGLTRISLRNLSEVQYLSLPPGLGAIRDVRFSPSGKLALVASLGKRLSLFSFESNNIVINYPLQSAPWSCAWDPSVPNQVYAGLQNGSLLIFDLRQTASPIASVNGSSTRPVHTLQTVQSHTRKGILSASSSGAYFWDMGATAALAEIQRPQCITDDYREKLCVSLAYAPCLRTAVASFRPSPLAHIEASTSAAALTQADSISQPGGTIRGSLEPCSSTQTTQENSSHCIFSSRFDDSCSESTTEGKVSRREWRWEGGKTMVGHKSTSVMPRSTIIVEPMSDISLRASFACGDEGTNAVWLWDMNTLNVTQTLVPHQSPVLDVKYVNIGERILIGCVSEKTFQLYRRPHSTV